MASELHLRKTLQSRLAASAHRAEAARRQLGGLEPQIADAEGKLQPGPHEVELREIEKFLALRVAAWLRYIFAHLRYCLLTALLCGLFVMTGVYAYAFQPKRYLSFGIWVALLIGSLLTLRIFARVDRNAVLSAISGTDPGKVLFDRTFFSNLFTYFGIPVAGVILTQFPVVGNLLLEIFSSRCCGCWRRADPPAPRGSLPPPKDPHPPAPSPTRTHTLPGEGEPSKFLLLKPLGGGALSRAGVSAGGRGSG